MRNLREPRRFGLMLAGVLFLWVPLADAEVTYDSGNRRDPFVPLEGVDGMYQGSPSGFVLEGIIYDPAGGSFAIINGMPYKAGDMAGEAKVTRIRKNNATLDVNGEMKTLWIRDAEKLEQNEGGEDLS